jgi:Peptidase family M20/M25/M40
LRFPKLYILLDIGKPHHRRQRTLECVHTFELPPDVGRFPAQGGAQRNGSTVGVPNDAAGRLRREHTNPVSPQHAASNQIARPARTSGLFVRHQHDSYTAECEKPFIACRGHYDVVPAQSRDQFQPRVKGANLFGRGSSDMKSGLAAMIHAAAAETSRVRFCRRRC